MLDIRAIQKQGLLWAKKRGLAKSPLDSFRHLEKELVEAEAELLKGDLDALREELADIILVTLSVGEGYGINMEKAIADKHLANYWRSIK